MAITLKGILGTVAPVIASALPGPLGGMAKKAVTDLLGLKDSSTQDEIEKTLATASPDTLIKLKQIDADFAEKMKQLDIDLERMSFEDTANARAREIATKDWTPKALAGLVVGGYVVVQFFVLTNGLPAANHDLILETLDILKYSVVLVLGYYFGSSAGSRNKDLTIHRMSTK